MPNLDPITRKEQFLSRAAGGPGLDLDPITREEHFLQAIADAGGGGWVTDAVKQALLQCFRDAMWSNDKGPADIAALYDALYPMESVSAVYTQSGTVYEGDSLDSLKPALVVTAHYTDGSTETVPDTGYTLSGTLTPGTSTITVTYREETTTFTVEVTQITVYQDGGDLYIVAGVSASQTDSTLNITSQQ